VAESFFASLRAELVDHERYATHDAPSATTSTTSTTSSGGTRSSATSTQSNSNCVPVCSTSGIVNLSTEAGDLHGALTGRH
jgi:hypothetical protein